MRSSLIVAANGSVSHGWPSNGTTSEVPRGTVPARLRIVAKGSPSSGQVIGEPRLDPERLQPVADPLDQPEVRFAAGGVEATRRWIISHVSALIGSSASRLMR